MFGLSIWVDVDRGEGRSEGEAMDGVASPARAERLGAVDAMVVSVVGVGVGVEFCGAATVTIDGAGGRGVTAALMHAIHALASLATVSHLRVVVTPTNASASANTTTPPKINVLIHFMMKTVAESRQSAAE